MLFLDNYRNESMALLNLQGSRKSGIFFKQEPKPAQEVHFLSNQEPKPEPGTEPGILGLNSRR